MKNQKTTANAKERQLAFKFLGVKTSANEFVRKFAYRKLFLQFTLLFVVGLFLTASAIETKNVKGTSIFASAAGVAMLIGKVTGKDTATHKADGTEKTPTEQLTFIIAHYKSETDAELAEAMKNADEENVKRLKTLLERLDKLDPDGKGEEVIKQLRKDLDQVGSQIKEIAEKPIAAAGYKTLRESLTEAFAVKEVKEEIEAIVKAGGKMAKPVNLVVKVDTMTIANTIGSGASQVTITQNTGVVSAIRKRELTYLAQVSVGTIATNKALWLEETTEAGVPAMTGENTGKSQISSVWVEKDASVKKVTAYTKVTTELMSDIPQLISYIESNLLKRLDIKLEDNYISGDNTGSNLNGVTTFATAFTGDSLAGNVQNPNEFDVLEALALQCETAFGIPSAVYIHPSSLAKMKLIKDIQGRPIWKDYITINGDLEVSGMKIVKTTAITAGQFVGGDMLNVHVLVRDELGIQIGLDGNDFTNNVKTMLAEKRVVQWCSANDVHTVIKGTFAAAIAALEEA